MVLPGGMLLLWLLWLVVASLLHMAYVANSVGGMMVEWDGTIAVSGGVPVSCILCGKKSGWWLVWLCMD